MLTLIVTPIAVSANLAMSYTLEGKVKRLELPMDYTPLASPDLPDGGLSKGWIEEVLNPSFRIEALENLISSFTPIMTRSGSP
jgi:hypothetical protein